MGVKGAVDYSSRLFQSWLQEHGSLEEIHRWLIWKSHRRDQTKLPTTIAEAKLLLATELAKVSN